MDNNGNKVKRYFVEKGKDKIKKIVSTLHYFLPQKFSFIYLCIAPGFLFQSSSEGEEYILMRNELISKQNDIFKQLQKDTKGISADTEDWAYESIDEDLEMCKQFNSFSVLNIIYLNFISY